MDLGIHGFRDCALMYILKSRHLGVNFLLLLVACYEPGVGIHGLNIPSGTIPSVAHIYKWTVIVNSTWLMLVR
jgi:hypothetical protein